MKAGRQNKDHNNKKISIWLHETRLMEEKDKEAAILEYKKIISDHPSHEEAYDRLMILYRILKKDKEEMRIIQQAIKIFNKSFKSPKKHSNAKVTSLSKYILRSTGLSGKNGEPIIQPEPISRWTRRLELLNKKNKTSG